MSKFSSFLVFFVLVLGVTDAQENDSNHTTIICGSDNHKHYSYDEKYEATYRKAVVNYFEKGIGVNKSNAVFTIPTVVHIIHDGSPLGTDVNPTDGEIISQIQRASDRFRHQQPGAETYTNPNYGVDTEIDLCLANVDPSGNYSSGILRYYDPINTNDPSYDYMNNLAWDKSLYNNIFIAKDIGGACGYANGQFTVYLASCFNPGLTCHELGHHVLIMIVCQMETRSVIHLPSPIQVLSKEQLARLQLILALRMMMIFLIITHIDLSLTADLEISQICTLTIWIIQVDVGMHLHWVRRLGCSLI